MPPVTEAQISDDIYKLVLDRPDKLNALNRELLASLEDGITGLDGTADVLIIEGAGDAFSAGADLDEAQSEGEDINLYQNITAAVREFDGIVIGKIHGYAIGGGFEMTLAFDLRYAESETVFQLTESEVGLPISNASTLLLPLIIGEGRARELVLTSRKFDAQEAEEMGLVAGVYDEENLEAAVRDVASDLIENKSRSGLLLNKKGLNQAFPLARVMEFEKLLNKHELAQSSNVEW